jgi:AcrR family transcriptional regulator
MTAGARAASTRRLLVEAARDAFAERGYRAATVADIVRGADTARGTFYLYFRNKEEVFEEVVAELCEELLRETGGRRRGDARESAVRAETRQYLRAFAARRALFRAMLEAFGGHPEVERRWLGLRARFVERIARGLQREAGRGRLPEGLDPWLAAEALAAMTEWLAFIEFVVRDRPAEGEEFDRLVETLVALSTAGRAGASG